MTEGNDDTLSEISGLNEKTDEPEIRNNTEDAQNDETVESSVSKKSKSRFSFGNKFGGSSNNSNKISSTNNNSLLAAAASPETSTITQKRGYLSCLYTMNDLAWEVVLFKRPTLSVSLIAMTAFLLMTTFYPLFHCVVLLLLLALCTSTVLALIKILLTAVAGKPAAHPYKSWLTQSTSQIDLTVLEKYLQESTRSIGPLINGVVQLVLFNDIRYSLIVFVLLYMLSYVTIYITLPYLIIASAVIVFVLPKIYSKTQVQVDSVLSKIAARYQIITDKIEKVVDTNS